jgi:hypothetical protein
MHDISVVALFCSDVRQEKGGTETIVGIYPDNMNIPSFPGAFVQMTIYVRMHLSTTFRPVQIITRVVLPDGSELDRSEMAQAMLEEAREKAKNNGAPYMGMITRFTVASLRINEPGRLQAIVSVDGVDIVAGALNCRHKLVST